MELEKVGEDIEHTMKVKDSKASLHGRDGRGMSSLVN